jgi:hypothetical protein
MLKRKGDPTDFILVLVILFFLAVSIVVALYANGVISNLITTTALNQSSAYSSINESFTQINQFTVQRTFTIMFGLLVIGVLVSSFLVRVHPVFLFIYIIFSAISIFVSIYLANAYAKIVANPMFASFAENYVTITWIMSNVAQIMLAVGALSMIIIFGKIGQSNVNTGGDL